MFTGWLRETHTSEIEISFEKHKKNFFKAHGWAIDESMTGHLSEDKTFKTPF